MKTFARRTMIAGLSVLGVLVARDASAHHSFSMFDSTKTVTMTGVVRTWEVVNPHSFLWLYVTKGDQVEVWGLETPAPSGLFRAGLTKATMQAGDRVTVEINPLRDGRTGGMLRKLTLPSGRTFDLGGPVGAGLPAAKN